MNGPDLVWAELSRGTSASITELVASYGGSTKAAAEAAGVAQRTIQRRMVGEARAAGRPTKAAQERGQSKYGQKLGGRLARAAHAATWRNKQLDVWAKGEVWISGKLVACEPRTLLEPIAEVDVERLAEAFIDGDKAGVWEVFSEALFDAYGLPGAAGIGGFDQDEIEALVMTFL